MGLYPLARRALFSLDAEAAHELTIAMFSRLPRLSTAAFSQTIAADPVRLMGLQFPNRVGLAAGLDKNGDCIEAFGRLGFGFIEVGTVTPRPQPGNPKPRMFRLPEHQALINRLGFNNKGVDYLLRRVAQQHYSGVLGINIGKNADTPMDRAVDDYLACLHKVHARADYITVNISSPNTRNLRELQAAEQLGGLLSQLRSARETLAQAQGKRTPMLVKIAPDMPNEQLAVVCQLLQEHEVDGLIATNTTIARTAVAGAAGADETGGLSGAPLRERANQVLQQARAAVGPEFPIIGVGGIGSGADARQRRVAGADLIQIYTGFIYKGPALIADCAARMLPCNTRIR